jgi:hypothetical protein
MSETFSQQAFGQPTFTAAHARASSSGFDQFDILDATQLFHEHEYHPGQHLHALHIPSHDVYPQDQHLAYDSSGVSLPGKHTPRLAFISFFSYAGTFILGNSLYLLSFPFPARGRNVRFPRMLVLMTFVRVKSTPSLAARDAMLPRYLRQQHAHLGRCVCSSA